MPFVVVSANVGDGIIVRNRTEPAPVSALQRRSETQVPAWKLVSDAGNAAGGFVAKLRGAAGALVLTGIAASRSPALQSAGLAGGCGLVAHPATKSAVKKMIPAGLNTRQLCGTALRTQAFPTFTICDLRLTRFMPARA
jgi:hypothetical protein